MIENMVWLLKNSKVGQNTLAITVTISNMGTENTLGRMVRYTKGTGWREKKVDTVSGMVQALHMLVTGKMATSRERVCIDQIMVLIIF